METQASPELQEKLNALRKMYLQQLPERRKEILNLWEDIPTMSNPESGIETLRNLVHRLSGSAGTYGLPDLSNIAKTLEYSLDEFPSRLSSREHEKMHSIHEGLMALDDVIQHYLQFKDRVPAQDKEIPLQEEKKNKKKTPKILFLDIDGEFTQEAKTIFESYGYKLDTTSDTASFEKHILQGLYDAAIIDIPAKIDDQKLFSMSKHISEESFEFPLFFISQNADLKTRLKVVRSGGRAFFEKPYDLGDIIEKLDKFLMKDLEQPYRILIIDDDYHQAAYHEAILQDEGMVTFIVTDPMKVTKPLIEFQPDVILMDLYMPECTGLELASMIRQQDNFVGLPIVFLSAEKRKEKQAAAMKLGGDEFLTKPVKQDDLISAISVRAERMRTLRSFMAQDSLTGLLNHSATQSSLDILLSQAKRKNSDLSFVLIDLDHFKRVNDNYGHLSGDHVLKRLARFLKQRLRHGDIIGRYGGEEFAIILPDTNTQNAFEVMESIRQGFETIQHPVQGKDTFEKQFVVTLSIGISSFPEFDDPVLLNQMADKALYSAKAAGRNKVVAID